MAAVNGLDPLAYLHADGVEAMVLGEVLEQAQAAVIDRKKREIEAIGVAVANALARAMRG